MLYWTKNIKIYFSIDWLISFFQVYFFDICLQLWILLNNKNGSDGKCSQCARFWLNIIKGILFGVWDLLQNSFVSGNIYRLRKNIIKSNLTHLLGVNSYASALIKWHPLPKWENDFCWFILLGLVEGKCWLKSYVSHLWQLLRYMFVVEFL